MDMNKRMWNRHKKALLDGVRNATDSDMQARFTELLVNMVEQEVMAATGRRRKIRWDLRGADYGGKCWKEQ